jgi:translation initiation factor IF-1
MAKEELVEMSGTVIESCRGGAFRVDVDVPEGVPGQHIALCHICGKIRKYHIRITVGDRVLVELSPYDLNKGRITYRER